MEDLRGAAGGLGRRPRTPRRCRSMVFAVGKEHGFEPLRDWFKALYEVLLGASRGAALWRVHRALRRRRDASR